MSLHNDQEIKEPNGDKKAFRKKFDKTLFQANDRRAREAVKSYAKSQGILLMDNIFNEFGVDLLEVEQADDNSIKIIATFECEIRNTWKTGPFPYSSLRLPMRKMKFKGSNFCVVNNDETYMMFISSELLETSKIEVVENKYSNGELEEFISIEVDACEMICLKPTIQEDDI